MNKITQLLTILSFFPVLCMAQTATENYVKTVTMLDEERTDSIQAVQYYNGLGYPTLSVTSSGGNGETAYALMTYDGLGRVSSSYLPVARGSSFEYKSPSTIITESSTFYNGDNSAFTTYHYDALDRITSSELPGQAWRSAQMGTREEYTANTTDDKVLHYEAHSDNNLLVEPSGTSYAEYPAGTLMKEVHKDADGKTIESFFDFQGNIILKRVGGKMDTYYVYDELKHLRFVLTPSYQKTKDNTISSYEYRYDDRGRVYWKKLPGAEYIQYWYDNADRVVCSQDAVMRKAESKKFRFTIYDNLGRVAIQGLCSLYSQPDNSMVKATYKGNISGFLGTGYEISIDLNSVFKNPELEIVNYYDRHDFINKNHRSFFTGMNVAPSVSQVGQLTGRVIKASNGEYLSQVMVYDIKGNLLEEKSRENGGKEVSHSASYSFTNKLESSQYVVTMNGQKPLTLSEAVAYNHHNDMMSFCTLSVEHGEPAISSTMSYEYDALGRLSKTIRPFTTSTNPAVEYKYDLHGWTKKIMTHSFQEELYYADGLGTGCYNGNISSIKWKDKTSSTFRGYKFNYDGANRLTQGTYGEGDAMTSNAGRFSESVEYDDVDGNIKTIIRNGKKSKSYGQIDNLTLSYDGYQLTGVSETVADNNATGSFEYKKAKGSEYLYDANGSLLADKSRGIAYISYDFNGHPTAIYFTNGNVTKYVYSATGQKLRAIYYTAMPNITRTFGKIPAELTQGQILYKDSTDYLLGGALTLKNGRIDKYYFEGGFARAFETSATTDRFVFYYYNQDHLGNNREVVDIKGRIHQVTNYYPFGAPFADPAAVRSADLQPYKYNGKELDLMHGLNTYDYGARQYDPILARWDRVDPLAEKNYPFSPYSYCAGDPVNKIDPDGRDDYYTSNGQFLFRDEKETDNIIIRNQALYEMKSMTGAEWINPDTPIGKADLSVEAYSAIYTNILKRAGFNTDKLLNGQVSIVKLKDNTAGDGPQYQADGFYNHEAVIPYANADIARCMNIDGMHQVTAYCHPLGDANRGYLSTISNVVNVLGIHEFECHGEKRITSEQHWKILQNQRDHNSWNKATPQLKALYRYLEINKIDNYSRPR